MIVNFTCFHFKIVKQGLLNLEQSSPYLICLAYFSYLAFTFLYYIFIRLFLEVANSFSLIVVILSYLFSSKLEQMWTFLTSGKATFFSELRFRLHLRYVADSLAFLADFNQLYGSAMYLFFLLLYPENATIWILILFESGRLSLLFRILLLTVAFNMILFGTALHYKAISLTRRLTDSGKYMAKVAVVSKLIRDSRIRLKLERYICLFNCPIERSHTVTYGRVGNVTMGSFGKVRQY